MNVNEREWILKDEVYVIAGAAMEVSKESGPGSLEAVHQEALEMELEELNIPSCRRLPVAISCKGRQLAQN